MWSHPCPDFGEDTGFDDLADEAEPSVPHALDDVVYESIFRRVGLAVDFWHLWYWPRIFLGSVHLAERRVPVDPP